MTGAITRGDRLKDRYRLEHTLGRGGMAAVWLGHDEVLDRPVAVKVLSDTIASDPGFQARFQREARMVAGLSHPNLVGVYDFSDEGGRPYLVMQFVPGETLAECLERGGRVDCDQLARELLAALSHIHAVGILHRDIKPGNIILEPDGTAKLIDFGIALSRDATALTSTGLVLGTERFAAPEVMEGRPATERSDLYSCGLALRSCEGQGSRALAALVVAMTSKEPRDRPLSAVHALERLEPPDAVAEQPTEAFDPLFNQPTESLPQSSHRTPPPTPPPSGHRRDGGDRRKVAGAILGLLAAATIAVLVASSGGGSPDEGGPQQASAGKGERASAAGGAVSKVTNEAEPAPPPEAPAPDPVRASALNERASPWSKVANTRRPFRSSKKRPPCSRKGPMTSITPMPSSTSAMPCASAAGLKRRSQSSNDGWKSPIRKVRCARSWKRPMPKPAERPPADVAPAPC